MVPELYRGLASTAVARGDYAGQQKWLEAFLKLDPKSAPALQALGQCMFQQKNPQAALQRFKEARIADASSPLPEIALAQLCQSTGDRENAKKWIKEALAAAPKDPKTHVAAATLAFQNEQYDEMFKEGSKTLELEPGNLEGLRLIGLWSYFQKNYKQAELYFEYANKMRKSKVFSLSNDLALALAEQKDEAKLDRALQIAQENLRQHPNSGTAIATVGWVYYKKKMLPEAEVQLRKAIAYGKADPDTFYQFARIRHERGYDAEAKQALEVAVGGTGPSAYRQDAKALLAALKK
jgi:tetratricopeptide (TPR) repeat protein